MPQYSERLRPSVGVYIACLLLIPALILVTLPVLPGLSVPLGIVGYLAAVVSLTWTAQVITVEDGVLRAGKASIDTSLIGRVQSFRAADARAERGTYLDARAWLCIRGWIDPVIRVEIIDEADPTPYWIVSTRHPEELAEIIRESQRHRSAAA